MLPLRIPKLIFGIICIVIIGLIDYFITIDLALSVCYLLPIFIVTRDINKNAGIVLSIISAIIWGIAEYNAKSNLYPLLILWNTSVRLITFLIIVFLVSSLNEAYEQEKILARTDDLTKTYNRRYFLEVFHLEIKRAIRYQHCLTLVYFDVDNFKLVNDSLGHHQGDELLCLIANLVRHSIRETDIFARLGGDEFAILLIETGYLEAELALKRIQQNLMQTVKKHDFPISFSIGAITFPQPPDSLDKMLEQVDHLMYQVKKQGKNGLLHHLWL